MNAETYLEAKLADSDLKLQWGRVLMNAETRREVNRPSFEGCASMGPRSHERGNRNDSDAVVSVSYASMGPRSHERGNTTAPQAVPRPYSVLQWGRVLMNAETRSGETDGAGNSWQLQWGRVLMNAETSRQWLSTQDRRRCFNGAAFS